MKKIIYPEKKDWMEILRRPALNTDTLRNTVLSMGIVVPVSIVPTIALMQALHLQQTKVGMALLYRMLSTTLSTLSAPVSISLVLYSLTSRSVDEVVLIRRGITVLYGTGIHRAYSAITYNVAHRSPESLPRQVAVVEGLVDQLERLLGGQGKTVDRSKHLIE